MFGAIDKIGGMGFQKSNPIETAGSVARAPEAPKPLFSETAGSVASAAPSGGQGGGGLNVIA